MPNHIVCTLQRLTEGDEGTFGTFGSTELGFSCVALELPDRQNRPMVSRIPAGAYLAVWDYSKRFKRQLYRLVDVPGRLGILIHPGNYAGDTSRGWRSDLSGCIALGASRTHMQPTGTHYQAAIVSSKKTMFEFENLCLGRRLLIVITDPEKNPYAATGNPNHNLAPPELCDEP